MNNEQNVEIVRHPIKCIISVDYQDVACLKRPLEDKADALDRIIRKFAAEKGIDVVEKYRKLENRSFRCSEEAYEVCGYAIEKRIKKVVGPRKWSASMKIAKRFRILTEKP